MEIMITDSSGNVFKRISLDGVEIPMNPETDEALELPAHVSLEIAQAVLDMYSKK